MKLYLNKEICKKCNGYCCKFLPGAAFPKDFGNPIDKNLKEAFLTKNWAIDWWDGDPRKGKDEIENGYFIRPRIKGIDEYYHPAWGNQGACIFFINNKGCKLEPTKRPSGCRLLEPKKNGNCIDHGGGKREAAIAWLSYHDMIKKIIEEIEYKEES